MHPSWITVRQILRALSFPIFLTNLIEIILLLKRRKRWKNAQILIFSLAVADATLGFSTAVIFSVMLSLDDHFTTSILYALTIMKNLIIYGNIYGSSFLVILISVDRWLIIKSPLRYRMLMRRRRLYFGIFLSWILAAITLSAIIFLNRLKKDYGWIFIGGGLLILETIILISLYISIFLAYRKNATRMMINFDTVNRQTQHNSRHKKEKDGGKNENRASSELLTYCNPHYTNENFNFDTVNRKTRYKSSNNEDRDCNESKNNRLYTLSGSYALHHTNDNFEGISRQRSRTTMTQQEIRLFKFCSAIVICFSFSYIPAATVSFIGYPTQNENLPWHYAFVTVNAYCGSLWNPFLYFLHQFFSRKRELRNKLEEPDDKTPSTSI